jgi:hypothetical protein
VTTYLYDAAASPGTFSFNGDPPDDVATTVPLASTSCSVALLPFEKVSVASASPAPIETGKKREVVFLLSVPEKLRLWPLATGAVAWLVAAADPAEFEAETCTRIVDPESAEVRA